MVCGGVSEIVKVCLGFEFLGVWLNEGCYVYFVIFVSVTC